MILARFIQIVNTQLRPVERRLDPPQRSRVQLLVDLDCDQHLLPWIRCLDESYYVRDWRRRASQIQPRDFVQGCAPRGRNEKDQPMVRRQAALGEKRFVVAMLQIDRSVQAGDIALRQFVDLPVELASHALRTREVSQDPVERVARTGKGVDDRKMSGFGKSRDNAGDVLADATS